MDTHSIYNRLSIHSHTGASSVLFKSGLVTMATSLFQNLDPAQEKRPRCTHDTIYENQLSKPS